MKGLRTEWKRFKRTPSGQRFVALHERHRAREAPWLKPIVFFSAVFAFGMGILLLVVPGPSVFFFLAAALLLPFESRTVAALYDRIDVAWRRLRHRKSSRAATEKGRLDPAELEAAVQAARASERPEPAQPEPNSILQPSAAQRVVWLKAVPPTPPPVAATTKIWASDLPVTPPPPAPRVRRTARTPVRPSQAVILVPPPVKITDARPDARATVPLRRRSRA